MSPSQNKAAMQEHIPKWQASRLTQTKYCKTHDIKPHTFSYYKKKTQLRTNNPVDKTIIDRKCLSVNSKTN